MVTVKCFLIEKREEKREKREERREKREEKREVRLILSEYYFPQKFLLIAIFFSRSLTRIIHGFSL